MSDLAIAAGPATASELVSRAEAVRRGAPTPAETSAAASRALPAQPDSVELSERARLLSRLRELPAVRADLVQRVRAAIDAGEYDGAEIPDTVIDRIVEDIEQFD